MCICKCLSSRDKKHAYMCASQMDTQYQMKQAARASREAKIVLKEQEADRSARVCSVSISVPIPVSVFVLTFMYTKLW